MQRERLVDLAAERVRALRELQGPPERVLDQQADFPQAQERPRREADDDGQNDGRHRRREAERQREAPDREEARPVWKSKFYGAFVLNHRVVLHSIDATPARWRGDAGSSPLDGASTAA